MSIFKKVKHTVVKHSPELLTGIGIAGMVTTTVLAVNATPKALYLIEEERNCQDVSELSTMDTIKVAWKPYIPAAVTGVTSIVCLIGASATNHKRNAALATAYNISQAALYEYKEKVIETLGEKKEKQIREEIDKDRIEKNPVSKSEVIITGNGKTLCYDHTSGRYFESDMETIKRAVNTINKQMLDEMYVSLNDFYYEVGLGDTKMGNELGWSNRGELIDLDFSSQIAEDGRPCLVIDFAKAPYYDYQSFY